MIILYTGSDNAMNFCWEEDNVNDRCRMIDWDLSEEEIAALVQRFKNGGLPEDEFSEWQDGRFTIRNTLNGYEEVAWRVGA